MCACDSCRRTSGKCRTSALDHGTSSLTGYWTVAEHHPQSATQRGKNTLVNITYCESSFQKVFGLMSLHTEQKDHLNKWHLKRAHLNQTTLSSMTSVVTLTFVVWSTFCHLLTGSAITSQSCPAFCSSLANVDFPTAVDVQKTHLHYQLDFKLSLHVRTGLLMSICHIR